MLTGFPMPRRPELCSSPTLREHVRREKGPRFPFPVPNGWFVVAASADLAPAGILNLHYFGRDLVLFRTEHGESRLVTAYCAHLGAHLGVGGEIRGDTIVCPFHGWCYDGSSGRCVEIPYATADRVPSQAAVRAFPTLERNGLVWAWHHLEGGEPFYDVPVLAEFEDPAWQPPVLRDFEIATCCQEMAENNHDPVHFQFVHGTDAIPEEDQHIEGPYKRVVSMGGAFVRETFGLGLGVVRIEDHVTFLSSTTPIDEEHVHVRWYFTAPVTNGEDAAAQVADAFLGGVSQDIPIWENKAYVDRPVLVKAERTILDHRAWCEQFYSYPGGV